MLAVLSTLLILGSPATAAAATAGVTDAPCPLGAIAVEPGASIQAAVDSAGDGAVFCLRNGMHRVQVVRPRTGQSFYGEGATVLNGSRLLTNFSREGRLLGGKRPIAARSASTASVHRPRQHAICLKACSSTISR